MREKFEVDVWVDSAYCNSELHSIVYLQRGNGTEEEGVLRRAPTKVRDGYTFNDVSWALESR